VTVPRRPDDDDADELGGHEMVQLAAAAMAGNGVVFAWPCSSTTVAMQVDAVCDGDALDAGVAVVRLLSCGGGAVTVTAQPLTAAAGRAEADRHSHPVTASR
jgi:hypothetical protein